MRCLICSPCFWSATVLCSGICPGCLPFGWFLILAFCSPDIPFTSCRIFPSITTSQLGPFLTYNSVWMLAFCLEPIIPPPSIIFVSIFKKYHTLLCLLLDSNTTQSSRWLLRDPLMARFPSSGAPAGQTNWCISLGCHWQQHVYTQEGIFLYWFPTAASLWPKQQIMLTNILNSCGGKTQGL